MLNVELTSFDCDNVKKIDLPIYVLFEKPSDFPNEYILRVFDLQKPTPYIMRGETKEELIEKLPSHVTYLPRTEEDDTVIVGTYF